MSYKVTRRQLLSGLAIGSMGAVLAACQPKVVEKVVKETVEVEKEKIVEKEVTQVVEKEVTKVVVEKEVIIQEGAIAQRGFGAWGGGRLMPPPKKYDITITTGFSFWNFTPPEGQNDSAEDNIVLRWVKDQTGVWYEHWARGDATQAWATAMAADDLPEAMDWVPGDRLVELIEAGRAEDITAIWEATASPLVLERTEYGKNKPVWGPVTSDGKLYGITSPEAANWCDSMWYVRKDLLDKAGLSMPKTLEEMTAVAKVFKEQGLAEIPIGFGNNIRSWYAPWDPVFGAFGVMPGAWLPDSKGGIMYGSLDEGNTKPLEQLSQWYKDGLVSPEWPTKDWAKWKEDCDAGKVGMWFMCANQWQWKNLLDNVEGSELVWAAGPAGPDGTASRGMTSRSGFINGVFRKGVDPVKIEAWINNKNWTTQRGLKGFENSDFIPQAAPMTLQFEGYDYIWDGDEIADGPCTTFHMCREIECLKAPTIYMENLAIRDNILAKAEADRNPLERYILTADTRWMDVYKVAFDTRDQAVPNELDGNAAGPMRQELWGDLAKLEAEYYTKFIVGDIPLAEFATFAEEWLKRGGDKVTAEVNEWYAAR